MIEVASVYVPAFLAEVTLGLLWMNGHSIDGIERHFAEGLSAFADSKECICIALAEILPKVPFLDLRLIHFGALSISNS